MKVGDCVDEILKGVSVNVQLPEYPTFVAQEESTTHMTPPSRPCSDILLQFLMEFGWLLWLHGLLERHFNCLQQQCSCIVFAHALSSLPVHLKGEKKQEERNPSPSHAASGESMNIHIGSGSSQHQEGAHQLKQNTRKKERFL